MRILLLGGSWVRGGGGGGGSHTYDRFLYGKGKVVSNKVLVGGIFDESRTKLKTFENVIRNKFSFIE